MRGAALQALAASEPAVMRYLDTAMARQAVRHALHAAALGQMDCEQRVASLLIELALRSGIDVPGGGVSVDLPLSRKEIADFLGLNPDTLSRIMSRLRTAGIVSQSERSRVIVQDLQALAARSPAAQSLMEIGGGSRIETVQHMAV